VARGAGPAPEQGRRGPWRRGPAARRVPDTARAVPHGAAPDPGAGPGPTPGAGPAGRWVAATATGAGSRSRGPATPVSSAAPCAAAGRQAPGRRAVHSAAAHSAVAHSAATSLRAGEAAAGPPQLVGCARPPAVAGRAPTPAGPGEQPPAVDRTPDRPYRHVRPGCPARAGRTKPVGRTALRTGRGRAPGRRNVAKPARAGLDRRSEASRRNVAKPARGSRAGPRPVASLAARGTHPGPGSGARPGPGAAGWPADHPARHGGCVAAAPPARLASRPATGRYAAPPPAVARWGRPRGARASRAAPPAVRPPAGPVVARSVATAG
jgi:hypothetical protein